ncbi:MAG: 4-(cytidine 5'-diphospho)-2-C-methyl-D-erythritol kinase [Erysipelotrichaceae bacterium]|jgi:4-diphosphocytidyl-2C-methyl-D-erythritol kinase|nr:4-(cytidine 5'-diphospho)-2-C-methyl-D-erythritol kinase [Erysipelotrichaceae bacterium]
MLIKAYAKINLSLNVFPKEPNTNLHQIDSIFLPIDLFDVIDIDIAMRNYTFVTCDDPDMEIIENNTISRAIKLMRDRYGFKEHFHVEIHKAIPVRGGLGGGSSNAAAVILYLNKLLNLRATKEELIEIAKQVGSDVTFFLDNKPARVTGFGEKVSQPIKLIDDYHVLLVKPQQGLSTAEVYQEADNLGLKQLANNDLLIKALETGDKELVRTSIFNSLQEAAIKLSPEIQSIIDLLKQEGFRTVMMSGSGSTVFALFRNEKKWLFSLMNKIRKMGCFVKIVEVKK